MSAALLRSSEMTVEEFVVWEPDDATGGRWQLVDGVPRAMAPASETHAAMQGELGRLIGNHLLDRGSRGRLITEPGLIPAIRAHANYRVPDLAVTCAPASASVAVDGPVLVIEILSPGNAAQSRANVWIYATIPSVRKILVIHSTRIGAELLRRQADGAWPAEPDLLGPGDTLAPDCIDMRLSLEAVYRTTHLAT